MSFLYLVEQYYGIRFSPNCLGKLASFLISHISWRRSYKTCSGKPLLVLGHIYTGHHVLIVEKEFSESFRQLCLSDSGGTEEKE